MRMALAIILIAFWISLRQSKVKRNIMQSGTTRDILEPMIEPWLTVAYNLPVHRSPIRVYGLQLTTLGVDTT